MIEFNLQLFGGRESGGGKGGGGSGGQVNRTSTHDGGEYEKEFVKQQTTVMDTWYYHGDRNLGGVTRTFSGKYSWHYTATIYGPHIFGGTASTLKEAMENVVINRRELDQPRRSRFY